MILKENNQIEIQLKNEFENLHSSVNKAQSFYQYWISNNLFELFYSVISNGGLGYYDSSGFTKYVQDSLLESFVSISFFYAENVKVKVYFFRLNLFI